MNLSIALLTPGPGEGKVIPIKVKQFLIGRDPGCHLRPASMHISKRHCALLRREDKVFLRDFGSTNGTFVNDRQIRAGEVELFDSDQVRVGQLLFAVHLGTACATPPNKAKTQKHESSQAAILPKGEPGRPEGCVEDSAAISESGTPEAPPQTETLHVTTVLDTSIDTLADKDTDDPTQGSGERSAAAEPVRGERRKRKRPT